METRSKRAPRPALPAAIAAEPVAAQIAAAPPNLALPPPATAMPMLLPPPAAAETGGDSLSALMESQAAVARGLAAWSAEMAGLARSGIDAAARTAGEMLAVKTLAEAIEVNAGFARGRFEALVEGSARLSEIGLQLAAEMSRPILAQFGRGWARPMR